MSAGVNTEDGRADPGGGGLARTHPGGGPGREDPRREEVKGRGEGVHGPTTVLPRATQGPVYVPLAPRPSMGLEAVHTSAVGVPTQRPGVPRVAPLMGSRAPTPIGPRMPLARGQRESPPGGTGPSLVPRTSHHVVPMGQIPPRVEMAGTQAQGVHRGIPSLGPRAPGPATFGRGQPSRSLSSQLTRVRVPGPGGSQVITVVRPPGHINIPLSSTYGPVATSGGSTTVGGAGHPVFTSGVQRSTGAPLRGPVLPGGPSRVHTTMTGSLGPLRGPPSQGMRLQTSQVHTGGPVRQNQESPGPQTGIGGPVRPGQSPWAVRQPSSLAGPILSVPSPRGASRPSSIPRSRGALYLIQPKPAAVPPGARPVIRPLLPHQAMSRAPSPTPSNGTPSPRVLNTTSRPPNTAPGLSKIAPKASPTTQCDSNTTLRNQTIILGATNSAKNTPPLVSKPSPGASKPMPGTSYPSPTLQENILVGSMAARASINQQASNLTWAPNSTPGPSNSTLEVSNSTPGGANIMTGGPQTALPPVTTVSMTSTLTTTVTSLVDHPPECKADIDPSLLSGGQQRTPPPRTPTLSPSRSPLAPYRSPVTPPNAKIRLCDLNPHLLCVLCGGYLIDATTIIECLHSFCRTCIHRYLESSKYCPICDVQVHKTRPLLNCRTDNTLQTLVYKLVPGLFKEEMKRRREYYAANPDAGPPASTATNAREQRGEVKDEGEVLARTESKKTREKISLCLQYSDRLPDPKSKKKKDSLPIMPGGENDRRYLLCPSGVTVSHLKKFLRLKFDLDELFKVELFHSDSCLQDNCTLEDITLFYSWKRVEPLKLFYVVQDVRLYAKPTSLKLVQLRHEYKLEKLKSDKKQNKKRKLDSPAPEVPSSHKKLKLNDIADKQGDSSEDSSRVNVTPQKKTKITEMAAKAGEHSGDISIANGTPPLKKLKKTSEAQNQRTKSEKGVSTEVASASTAKNGKKIEKTQKTIENSGGKKAKSKTKGHNQLIDVLEVGKITSHSAAQAVVGNGPTDNVENGPSSGMRTTGSGEPEAGNSSGVPAAESDLGALCEFKPLNGPGRPAGKSESDTVDSGISDSQADSDRSTDGADTETNAAAKDTAAVPVEETAKDTALKESVTAKDITKGTAKDTATGAARGTAKTPQTTDGGKKDAAKASEASGMTNNESVKPSGSESCKKDIIKQNNKEISGKPKVLNGELNKAGSVNKVCSGTKLVSDSKAGSVSKVGNVPKPCSVSKLESISKAGKAKSGKPNKDVKIKTISVPTKTKKSDKKKKVVCRSSSVSRKRKLSPGQQVGLKAMNHTSTPTGRKGVKKSHLLVKLGVFKSKKVPEVVTTPAKGRGKSIIKASVSNGLDKLKRIVGRTKKSEAKGRDKSAK